MNEEGFVICEKKLFKPNVVKLSHGRTKNFQTTIIAIPTVVVVVFKEKSQPAKFESCTVTVQDLFVTSLRTKEYGDKLSQYFFINIGYLAACFVSTTSYSIDSCLGVLPTIVLGIR